MTQPAKKNEIVFKVKAAKVQVDATHPLRDNFSLSTSRYSIDPAHPTEVQFQLNGIVDQMVVSDLSAAGDTQDYDIEVTVKMVRKFVTGHYRNKRKGAHATALWFSTPPWTRAAHDSNPDHWERVNVARSMNQ